MTTSSPPRSILITGCSSGCGLDAALRLKKDGWRVFAACRKQADCDARIAEGFESPRLDYQDEASIDAAWEEVMAATGGTLSALFNNGAYSMRGAVEDVETAALREIFDANFFGWHHLTRKAIKCMRKQGTNGKGHIIQHSSGFGLIAAGMNMPYCATKFALEAHSMALRHELYDTDIHVTLLNTGFIKTEIREKSRIPYTKWIKPMVATSAFKTLYEQVIEPRIFGPYRKDPLEEQVDSVTNKVVHALASDDPPARYFITPVIYLLSFLLRILPTKTVDAFVMRIGMVTGGKAVKSKADARDKLHPPEVVVVQAGEAAPTPSVNAKEMV